MEEKENTYVQSTRQTKMYSHCLKWQAHCAKTMCMTKGNCATKCPSFWRLLRPPLWCKIFIIFQDSLLYQASNFLNYKHTIPNIAISLAHLHFRNRVSRSVKLPDQQEDMNMGMAAFGLCTCCSRMLLQLQTHNYFFREIPFLR